MRTGSSIAHVPLLIGIGLSVAAHGVALYVRGESEPAKLEMESGRTVVQITLIPSVAAQPTATKPPPTEQPEPIPEPVVEPAPEPEPVFEADPLPTPVPEPVVEPAPEPVLEPEIITAAEPTLEPTATDSIEQDASEISDKGVEIEAAPVTRIRASYPRSAQKRGHEGTVVLSIQVRANGSAGDVRILESSGYKLLDAAAIKAAEKAQYAPAKNRGRAVDSEIIQPIVFRLD